jgi:hypothetical protein
MAIPVLAVHPNRSVPESLTAGGIRVLSGIVECMFKGDPSGEVSRDTLTFSVGRVSISGGGASRPIASCTMSVASFAYDGPVGDALWAIDGVSVPAFVNEDRGSGTADLQVVANLAVRGANGAILRVNYIVIQSGV